MWYLLCENIAAHLESEKYCAQPYVSELSIFFSVFSHWCVVCIV